MNVASARCGLFPRPNGAGPHRPTPVWQWPRARARCVPPILPLSPAPSPPTEGATAYQLQKRAARLRLIWAQPLVGSQARVLIVRINCGGHLEDRGHSYGRSQGLIAGRLSSGGWKLTAQKAGCPSEGGGRPAFRCSTHALSAPTRTSLVAPRPALASAPAAWGVSRYARCGSPPSCDCASKKSSRR